jgi:hypothetical protein
MLLRRVAEDREVIDLSVSAPGDLRHLPPVDAAAAWELHAETLAASPAAK